MRQDRRNFNPRPRPTGYRPNEGYPQNRRPPMQPAAPKRRKPPAPPIPPKVPTTGKQRKRMLKAAAWRLAKLAHVLPRMVLTSPTLDPILDNASQDPGEARRLAKKIKRLRTAAPPAR